MKIKNMPAEERPIERAFRVGFSSLTNSELIALIIKTGNRGKTAISLGTELMSSIDGGLKGLAVARPEDLMKFPGIGRSKACAVLAAVELGKRILAPAAETRYRIRKSEDVAGLVMQELRYERKEHFICILLNTKGEVLSVEKVSTGILSATPVHPREVFSPAVRMSAASVIFVHNHPSGDPEPSTEDIETNERLCRAGKLLGISVLDHIIIGDGRYISFLKRGLMD
jgi:DNA repair protein RadC